MTPDPAEGAAVAGACEALLGGGTLSGVMREWSAAGLRPAQAPFGPLPGPAPCYLLGFVTGPGADSFRLAHPDHRQLMVDG